MTTFKQGDRVRLKAEHKATGSVDEADDETVSIVWDISGCVGEGPVEDVEHVPATLDQLAVRIERAKKTLTENVNNAFFGMATDVALIAKDAGHLPEIQKKVLALLIEDMTTGLEATIEKAINAAEREHNL